MSLHSFQSLTIVLYFFVSFETGIKSGLDLLRTTLFLLHCLIFKIHFPPFVGFRRFPERFLILPHQSSFVKYFFRFFFSLFLAFPLRGLPSSDSFNILPHSFSLCQVLFCVFCKKSVGLSMMCYTLGKENKTSLGDNQLRGRIGKLLYCLWRTASCFSKSSKE